MQFQKPAAPAAAAPQFAPPPPKSPWLAAAEATTYIKDPNFEIPGDYVGRLISAEAKSTQKGKFIAKWSFEILSGPEGTVGQTLTYLRVKSADPEMEAYFNKDVKSFCLALTGYSHDQFPPGNPEAAKWLGENVIAPVMDNNSAVGVAIKIRVTVKPKKNKPGEFFTDVVPLGRADESF